ncbi:hypothetical protein KHQ82_07090 [Mycoplasmatota bacterium]|nr:hypothetical protein KHQ82_07090 [Mycoplasmatota bacterium]
MSSVVPIAFFIANIIIILIIIYLQIFLSKIRNRWVGLILPSISLCIAILASVSAPVYYSETIEVQSINEDGESTTEVIEYIVDEPNIDISSTIFTVITTFVLFNVPTLILIGIYIASRDKIKKNSEIEKMSIIDLQ